MMKRALAAATCVLTVALGMTGLAAGPAAANGNCATYFDGRGTGTDIDPYQVSSRLDLEEVAYCPTSSFLQTTDIDLAGGAWTPIQNFSGTYNGSSFEISNLTVTTGQNVGLFSILLNNSVISGVVLTDVSVSTSSSDSLAGALAGSLSGESARVANTTAQGSVSVTATGAAGGLLGDMYRSELTDSMANVNVEVSGTAGKAGGLVGTTDSAMIIDSFAVGDASAPGSNGRAGGLASDLTDSSIATSYAVGNVSADAYAGGLVATGSGASIENSYASGNVGYTGDGQVGGLAAVLTNASNVQNSYAVGIVSGQNSGGLVGAAVAGSAVADSFWDTEATGQAGSSGGGTGLTTAEMQQITPYTNASWSISTGWSGSHTWGICTDESYPLLNSQVNDFPCEGHIVPSTIAVDYGPVTANYQTVTAIVEFTNASNVGIAAIQTVDLTGDAVFSTTSDECTNAELFPGDSCDVEVTFEPDSVAVFNGSLSVGSNGVASPTTVQLEGVGIEPVVEFNHPSVAFADQPINSTSAPQTLTVTNGGIGDLQISDVLATGADAGAFSVDAPATGTSCLTTGVTPVVVEPDDSCSIAVTFAPTSAGAKSATLVVSGNVPDATLPLSGTGVQDDPTVPQTVGRCVSPNAVKIRRNGSARLMGSNCDTNAGQAVGVAVSRVGPTGRGDVRPFRLFCQTPAQARRGVMKPTISTGHGRACARGVLKIRTYGKKGLRLRVRWYAPATGNYSAYRVVRTYRA